MKHAKPMPAGFIWCNKCQASREHWHQHGDPIEAMTTAELIALVRVLRLVGASPKNGSHR